AQRQERGVGGPGRRLARSLRWWIWRALAPALHRTEQLISPSAPAVADAYASDLLELRARGWRTLADLHQRGIAEDALRRPVLAGGSLLAPLHQFAGDRPRVRA